ncbi:MAG: aminotransferase class III-fold pyridoxal phosphate-dependent enzyme, partial [Pseudomonadota bacterium]
IEEQSSKSPKSEKSPINKKAEEDIAVNSQEEDSSLARIINQQLAIMSQQLVLLQGKTPTKSQDLPKISPHNNLSSQKQEEKKTLTKLPNFTPQQQQYIKAFIKRYNGKTAKSKEKAALSRRVLADSRASAGFRPSIKELVYPIIGEKAEGAYFWDIDGNKYLDITMGFGVLLLGHNPPIIEQAIKKQLAKGLQIGPQSNLAAEVAQLIQDLTAVERVLFCNSGTEAIMTALRLARTVTGRCKVALFTGSYHGHFDGVLGVATPENLHGVPMIAGIAENAVKDLLVLDFDHPESLEILAAYQEDLAAVLVEPVPSRRPNVQPQAFLQKLRTFTQNADIPLIFDEVLLGFRIHLGGAQKWFGIEADIVTYGKIVGGGLPIGVVGGKSRYLDA